jgi:Uma2 family endonuclease
MGMLANLVSLEEYLTNPAYKHHEWMNGQPVRLNVGTKEHSRIQIACGTKLSQYLETQPGGYVAAELHCRLSIAGETRFRLPDIAVVLNDDDPKSRYLDRAPDFVIEIRSPEDTLAGIYRKIDDYFANGARLAWLILPEEETIFVMTPDGRVRTAVPGETLDGGDVLPDLTIAVRDLFL